MTKSPSCILPVRSASTGEILFSLQFYGLELSDLYEVPNVYVTEAMRRRGFKREDFAISMFDIYLEPAPQH